MTGPGLRRVPLATLAVLLGACSAPRTQPSVHVVEDQAVERTIRAEALRLLSAPGVARAPALLASLARTSTMSQQLPPVGEATRQCAASTSGGGSGHAGHGASQAVARLRRATLVFGVLYQCGSCQAWHLSLASGALVGDAGLAVTNLHVLQRPGAAVVVAMTADGVVHPVTAGLAADPQRDVALVQLRPGPGFRGLALGVDPPQGTQVWLMSHPDRRFYFLTRGHVARTYLAGKPPAPMLEITAAFARGSSGGPVVDRCGRLLGLATNTHSVYYRKEAPRDLQLVLGRAVPVSALRALFRP